MSDETNNEPDEPDADLASLFDLRFDPDDKANRLGKYILDDEGEPVPEPDLLTWGLWMETGDRRILFDAIGRTRVSTIFLGLDHGFERFMDPSLPAVLWETMVFGSCLDGYQTRYTSKLDALAGHALARDLVERFGTLPRKTKKAIRRYHDTWRAPRPSVARRVRRWEARMQSYKNRGRATGVRPNDS